MIRYYFITVYCWIVFILTSILMFIIVLITKLLTFLFDPKLRILQWMSCFWASLLVWSNPLWKTTFLGRKKIKDNQTYVILCNHQSYLDILVLYGLFKNFKWVSKSDIFKIPIVGWNMTLNNYISVNRNNKRSQVAMLKACEDHLHRGSSIMIFPEGTRSKDGEIHTFKEGAFRLALAAKVSVVPIVVDGTLHGFPTKGLLFDRTCKISVKVLDPIPYESFSNDSSKEIANKAFKIMSAGLKTLRE